MTNVIIGVLVAASLIVGFGAKYLFGEIIGEKTQDVIETMLKSHTKVDVSTLFDLDDKK